MSTDRTTDLARLEAESAKVRALVAATQHRVRNTLAVIRSIARRSAETSDSVEEYAAHLDGRIGAFARIQGALLHDPDAGLALDTLVSNALLSVVAREGKRWTLDGPTVTLKAKTAEPMGLALHELATNAVKFGALSWPRGRITVSWRLVDGVGAEGAPRLVLTWVETGAPETPLAERRGFGIEMLEKTIAYELGAETVVDFTPEGVICRIALPLNAVHPLVS